MSAEVIQFDPTVPQRASFLAPKGKKKYPVTHVFTPYSDETYLSLERMRNVRMKEAEGEIDEADAFFVADNSFAASCDFWQKNCTEVEGYNKSEDGPLSMTDVLAVKIPGNDKNYAVQSMLFFVDVVPNPIAEADEFYPLDEAGEDEVIQIRVFHQGQELTLAHTLRPASTLDYSRYREILAKNFMVRGTRLGRTEQKIPSKAKPLGDLYDSMIKDVEGYKDGKNSVILAHKVRVITEHLGSSSEAITGK